MNWTEEKLRVEYFRFLTVALLVFWICMVVRAFLDGPEDNALDAANEGEPEGVHNEVEGTHRTVVNPVLELHRTVDHVINDLRQTINAVNAADDDDSTPAAAADRRRTQRVIDVFTLQLWAGTDHFFAAADDDDDDNEASAVAAAAAAVAAGWERRPGETRSASGRGNRSNKSHRFSRKHARERTTRNDEKTTAAASSEDRFEDTTTAEDGLDGGCSGSVASETDASSPGSQDTNAAATTSLGETKSPAVTCNTTRDPTDEEMDEDCVCLSPAAEEDLDAHKVQDADDDDSTPVTEEVVARSNRNHDDAMAASVDVNDDRRNKGSDAMRGSGKFGGKGLETSAPLPSTNPIIDHLNAKLLEQLTADIVQRLESQKVSENRLREELETMVKARRDSERCYSDVVEQMKRFGLAWEGVRPKEAIKGQETEEDQATDEHTP